MTSRIQFQKKALILRQILYRYFHQIEERKTFLSTLYIAMYKNTASSTRKQSVIRGKQHDKMHFSFEDQRRRARSAIL